MLKFTCWLLGHDWKRGEWVRTPWSVATHWREFRCRRCNEYGGGEVAQFDALTQPEMFGPAPELLRGPIKRNF